MNSAKCEPDIWTVQGFSTTSRSFAAQPGARGWHQRALYLGTEGARGWIAVVQHDTYLTPKQRGANWSPACR